jgi:hypothetical protein
MKAALYLLRPFRVQASRLIFQNDFRRMCSRRLSVISRPHNTMPVFTSRSHNKRKTCGSRPIYMDIGNSIGVCHRPYVTPKPYTACKLNYSKPLGLLCSSLFTIAQSVSRLAQTAHVRSFKFPAWNIGVRSNSSSPLCICKIAVLLHSSHIASTDHASCSVITHVSPRGSHSVFRYHDPGPTTYPGRISQLGDFTQWTANISRADRPRGNVSLVPLTFCS